MLVVRLEMSHPELVEHIFGVDADDPETIDAVQLFVHAIALPPKGCFRAYNVAALKSTGDLLIPIEDDLHPDPGWDEHVTRAMEPYIDQVATLAVSDGQNPCIEWAWTRAFYNTRGLFHDDYYGLFGDTEWRYRARADQVLCVAAPHIRFDHRQYQPNKDTTDAIYERKQAKYLADEATFNRRGRENWP